MHNKWYSLTRPAVVHFNPPRDTMRMHSRRIFSVDSPIGLQAAFWKLALKLLLIERPWLRKINESISKSRPQLWVGARRLL